MAFNTRVVNIWGNAAPDIGNTSGTDQTLRIWNTGTGNALQVDSAGTVSSLVATTNALGAATVAPISIVASTASQAFLNFSGVFISTASINPTKAAFVIPVYHNSIAAWGYTTYGLFQSDLDQNLTVSVKPKRQVVGNTEGSLCDPVETTRWLSIYRDEDIVHATRNSGSNMI